MSSQSNTYELTYFPVKGLGNLIRIILEDQGVEYKFNLVTLDKWPEFKPNTPFGQLPVLTVNGEAKLSQSHTIARYFGRELGLMGANNLEQAQVEMWIDQTIDVRQKFIRMMYTDYENGRQAFVDSIPGLLEPFEKQLSGQENKAQLLFGKLTIVDYIFYDLLLNLTALSPQCLAKLPNIKAFFDAFGAREKVAAFMNRDDIKEMKFTGTQHL